MFHFTSEKELPWSNANRRAENDTRRRRKIFLFSIVLCFGFFDLFTFIIFYDSINRSKSYENVTDARTFHAIPTQAAQNDGFHSAFPPPNSSRTHIMNN